jgi:hypothetical protein
VEVIRNGEPAKVYVVENSFTEFRTNLNVVCEPSTWYCVRAFGRENRSQRAVTSAFFFADSATELPGAAPMTVRVGVMDAGSGSRLRATLTEVTYVADGPRPGMRHEIEGEGTLVIPGTVRLRAEVEGYRSQTLSPFLDYAPLLEFITGLGPDELLDWRTYEEVRRMLGEVELTFRLEREDGSR